MKSAVQTGYNGISSVQVTDIPNPRVGPLATLITGSYAPVLPWDIKAEEGLLPDGERRALPSVVGYGASGLVNNAGILGARSLIGRRVIALSPSGTNAQIIAAPLAHYVIPVPDEVTMEQAATVIAGADTARMLMDHAHPTTGARIAVIGATGGVGVYLVQMLSNAGIVPDVLSSARSADFARQIFPNSRVFTDRNEFPRGYDIVFDLTGNPTLISTGEQSLRSNGLLVASSTPGYRPQRPDIRGAFHNGPLSPTGYRTILRQIADGTLMPVIDRIFSLTEVQQAQSHVKSGPHRGRTLLQLNA